MRHPFVLSALIVSLVLIFIPILGHTQVTREDYARAEQFLFWNIDKLVFRTQVIPHFIGKTDRFWYCNETRGGKEFVLVDPVLNIRQPAFDQVRLAAGLSAASGSAYEPNKLPFDSFNFIIEGRAIQFDIQKTRWTCDLATYTFTKADTPKGTSGGELISPDSYWAAFNKDHNVFVRSNASGEVVRLTNDGEPYYDYATTAESSTHAVTDRLSGREFPPVLIWSPDSKKIVTYRLDQRKVEPLHLIQSVPPQGARPVLHSYRYALVGDKNIPLAEMLIFNIEQKKKIILKYEPLPVIASPVTGGGVAWSVDSQSVYFIHEERGNKVAKLLIADALTGETKTLIEEKGSNDVRPKFFVLGNGSEIIWFSERDGWAHLYLYDSKTGALKNQITKGPWVVRHIIRVDEKNRWIYFAGGGREKDRDPYFPHIYRIKLDGSNMQLLTPEDASHTLAPYLKEKIGVFSPSGRYFVDTYSRVDLAPVSVLRDSEGRLVRELEKADIGLLLAKGWNYPERFCVKARDGVTDLYGVLFKPTNFDPAKKYPVIDHTYPGPYLICTPKSFGFGLDEVSAYDFWIDSGLAELGFIVVNIDGLGTPLRSKAFHDFSYINFEDAGLEDRITGLRQLAAGRPFMDLTRVGIFGHSAGGSGSTRGILAYPDFYKVGVSSAGSHDLRSYMFGSENHQGLLEGDNYKNVGNASLASNLKGKLLLIHGELDDNVHPALTMQVVDALIKANKDFELLVMPNRNHDISDAPYWIRRTWDFFVRYLLGMEPPAGYEIKQAKLS